MISKLEHINVITAKTMTQYKYMCSVWTLPAFDIFLVVNLFKEDRVTIKRAKLTYNFKIGLWIDIVIVAGSSSFCG